MAGRERTTVQKVADWFEVYQAIKAELTPQALRELTALASADSVASINVGLGASRITFANDRMAAQVAAMLTQSGVSRPISEVDDAE